MRSGRGRARLDRERSDLVATVAHELRSPLTGVKGFVQALLNRWDKLNDEQKKLMLTTVSADADRLSRLIAELLDVARIDTGRLQLYPRAVDAAVLVRRVVDSVARRHRPADRARTPRDGAAARSTPTPTSSPRSSPTWSRTPSGTATGTVTREPASARPTTDGVRLVVEDEGDGIPPELRRRVFTKFWTASRRGLGARHVPGQRSCRPPLIM